MRSREWIEKRNVYQLSGLDQRFKRNAARIPHCQLLGQRLERAVLKIFDAALVRCLVGGSAKQHEI